MSSSAKVERPKPRRIQRLPENVVSLIAAGEVVQRPSNALKELLENSLDAQSTKIQISLTNAGITELIITDDGCGIAKEDFPLICERFATSKLKTFEDLNSIATYGFRGEALASISFCSQLTLTSKTGSDQFAHKATFSNGKMEPNSTKGGKETEPKKVAGTRGTQIIIRNLFYNMPLRLKAMSNRSRQEYMDCLKVVNNYAIQLIEKERLLPLHKTPRQFPP